MKAQWSKHRVWGIFFPGIVCWFQRGYLGDSQKVFGVFLVLLLVVCFTVTQDGTMMCVCVLSLFSHMWLGATPWTVAFQAPQFMRFSRQGYWTGLTCPPSGDLPDPGIKPRCPALQKDSLPSELPGKPRSCLLLLLSHFSRVRLCATP